MCKIDRSCCGAVVSNVRVRYGKFEYKCEYDYRFRYAIQFKIISVNTFERYDTHIQALTILQCSSYYFNEQFQQRIYEENWNFLVFE